MKSAKVVIRFNDRQYNPGEWEAWYQSEPIAHAQDLDRLIERYPEAAVIDHQHA